jgi:lipid II:glycine glycyltransferase (peptidoglycan interpeptide bridge formation enzyme)
LRELVISHPERDGDRLSVTITLSGRGLGDRARAVYFKTSESIGREEDFLLPLTLPLAMITDSRLKLPGRVSSRLLSSLPKLQDMFHLWGTVNWGAQYQRIAIDVEAQGTGTKPALGVACFFSGGVDSFYTLLKNRNKVTHLIFVHGFDITLANRSLRAQASHAAREVARELGKNLIEVETDLRSFSDSLVDWDLYHGAALASVGLLFQHLFREVLIPSTATYAELYAWGSHPLLDPLWSTDLTSFDHHGCEATRADKSALISNSETAMRWLRVCWVNPSSAYNCGRCEKCRWTMMNLHEVGALGLCRTLPKTLNFDVNSPTNDLKREPPKLPPGMGRVVRRGKPRVELMEILEPEEWDAAIKTLGGSITQSWGWGLAEQFEGWKPLRLLDEEDRGAVQLLFNYNQPRRFPAAYAPYGPLVADTSDLAEVLASAARCARQRGAYLLTIEPRWAVEANREILRGGTYVQAKKQLPGRTVIVDLPEDPEEHFRSLPEDTRYGVRQAHREGVEVVTLYKGAMNVGSGIGEFYELLKDTSKRQGFYVKPQAFYQRLIIDAPVYLLLARYEGRAVAGAIITTFGDEACCLRGASTAERGNLYAPYLLQWEAMDVARRAGCSRYDMWGVPRPSYAEPPGFDQSKNKFAGTIVEFAEASTRILSHLAYWEQGAIIFGTKGRRALRELRSKIMASGSLRS